MNLSVDKPLAGGVGNKLWAFRVVVALDTVGELEQSLNQRELDKLDTCIRRHET